MARSSPPNFTLCAARVQVSESMIESEYGLYGVPRPFAALFWRSSPPGMAMPDDEPCPEIPVLATLPLRLIVNSDRSIPLTVGACPAMDVSAAL